MALKFRPLNTENYLVSYLLSSATLGKCGVVNYCTIEAQGELNFLEHVRPLGWLVFINLRGGPNHGMRRLNREGRLYSAIQYGTGDVPLEVTPD